MNIHPRFAGVFRPVHQGQPITDANEIDALLKQKVLPQGNIHFSDPQTQSFYIVTPPDEDEFSRLFNDLSSGTDPAQAFQNLNKALSKKQDFEV